MRIVLNASNHASPFKIVLDYSNVIVEQLDELSDLPHTVSSTDDVNTLETSGISAMCNQRQFLKAKLKNVRRGMCKLRFIKGVQRLIFFYRPI